MPAIPCILCGEDLEQRTDKKNKPYFVCDPCGTQFFVRRKQGIEKLEELMHALAARDRPLRARARTVYEIGAILLEIDGVKREIKKLENKIGLFRTEKEEVRARKLLKTRLRSLLVELARICKQE